MGQLGQPASGGRGRFGDAAADLGGRVGQPLGYVLLIARRPQEFVRPVTFRRGTESAVHLDPARLTEVAKPLLRRPVERHPAPGPEHQHTVASVQVFQVMSDHDDRSAVVD